MIVRLDGSSLTVSKVSQVARGDATVVLTSKAKKAVVRCRKTLEDLIAKGKPIYGVTTGIGELAEGILVTMKWVWYKLPRPLEHIQ